MTTAIRFVARNESRWLVTWTSGYCSVDAEHGCSLPELRHAWLPGELSPKTLASKFTNPAILPEVRVTAREIARLEKKHSNT